MLLPKNREQVSMLARQRHNAILGKSSIIRGIQHSVVLPILSNREPTVYEGRHKYDTKISVTKNDVVTEIFQTPSDQLVGVLNFASYKSPGGLYLAGSVAQEEFLCHHSNLFEILCGFKAIWYEPHMKSLHNGMYTNDAIWSECVTFFDYEDIRQVAAGADSNVKQRCVGVLTMSAPNYKVAVQYKNIPIEQYNQVLYDRLYHVMQNFYRCNVGGILILGAYGCGVFRNDPSLVAQYFKDIIEKYFPNVFKEIRFAVPEDSTRHYQIFKNVIEGGIANEPAN